MESIKDVSEKRAQSMAINTLKMYDGVFVTEGFGVLLALPTDTNRVVLAQWTDPSVIWLVKKMIAMSPSRRAVANFLAHAKDYSAIMTVDET